MNEYSQFKEADVEDHVHGGCQVGRKLPGLVSENHFNSSTRASEKHTRPTVLLMLNHFIISQHIAAVTFNNFSLYVTYFPCDL